MQYAARQRCTVAPLAAARSDGTAAPGMSVQLAAAAASAAIMLSASSAFAVSGGGGLGNDFDFQGGCAYHIMLLMHHDEHAPWPAFARQEATGTDDDKSVALQTKLARISPADSFTSERLAGLTGCAYDATTNTCCAAMYCLISVVRKYSPSTQGEHAGHHLEGCKPQQGKPLWQFRKGRSLYRRRPHKCRPRGAPVHPVCADVAGCTSTAEAGHMPQHMHLAVYS
jgi:hypothetical protein